MTSGDLVIVGAGGFGREVIAYARDAGLNVIGCLDDADAPDIRDASVPHLGSVEDGRIPEGACAVIAIGDAAVRFAVHQRLQERGIPLGSVVHPTAYVADSAELGDGVILCPFSMVGTHAVVGANTAVNTYASVGHDAVVGMHCVFSPYSAVNGHVELGDGVFLGSNSLVSPSVTVGAWSKLGSGAVAARSIKDGTLAIGNPAKGRQMFTAPTA